MPREFPGRRLTVEESAALRIRDLVTAGVFAAENTPSGTLSYPDRANATQDYKVIRIREKTWLLLVPGLLGRPCGRRVSALYLPPGSSTLFGCRHCYNLSYRSIQRHDKRVDRAARNPALILDLLDSKTLRHQLVAVAALNKLRARLRSRR